MIVFLYILYLYTYKIVLFLAFLLELSLSKIQITGIQNWLKNLQYLAIWDFHIAHKIEIHFELNLKLSASKYFGIINSSVGHSQRMIKLLKNHSVNL